MGKQLYNCGYVHVSHLTKIAERYEQHHGEGTITIE
jgi:hypothetical protein